MRRIASQGRLGHRSLVLALRYLFRFLPQDVHDAFESLAWPPNEKQESNVLVRKNAVRNLNRTGNDFIHHIDAVILEIAMHTGNATQLEEVETPTVRQVALGIPRD